MSQRIKGQEVEMVLTLDGVAQSSLDHVRSVDWTFKLEILEEGYLGKTTNEYDSVFKGIEGSLELHFSSREVFVLVFAFIDKARARTPGTLVNIKATCNFPDGKRARVLFPSVELGAIPVKFGSRTDYGTLSLPFACSEAKLMPL